MSNEKDTDRGHGQVTPPDGPVTPEETARRLDALAANHHRAGDLLTATAKLVREGGFDSRTRSFLLDVAEHVEDLSDIDAGTGLNLRRLAQS